ncbi:hypothetical protein CERSUDRAFT_86728 [Gelatoporia subvermispora B]|uniref:Uncharacterized protein n=1 Tax=Ceriporiopsis subvermispora (strain B) TaxID=914234 RepID=M2R6R3_CERS8|nr:hypothetical protein CERSUDRAFT_86728 [Gelatoporia subvermispora B]
MAKSRRSILITGCSRDGIGDALAQQFHAQGLQVFATSRTLQSMEHLAAMGITTLALDVTDRNAIQDVKTQISEITGGKLDILVNNAGQDLSLAAVDYNMSDVRALFEVNVFAVMTMVQEFVPLLIASGDGRILQIGSVASIMPVPFDSAYSATKAALLAYSNTLRVELAPFKIKVITVQTGGVKSNVIKMQRIPDSSLYEPIQEEFQARRLGNVQDVEDTAVYAKTVVKEVLSKSPSPVIWAGNHSWTCWLMDTFFPRTIWDTILPKMYGLSALAGLLAIKSKDI